MNNLDYLYNPNAAKILDIDCFVDKKLGFQVIENGMILPHKDVKVNGKWTWGSGGIVDSNGTFINGTSVKHGVGKSYTPPPESIQYSSETVIYLGLFYPVWGHVITDNIRRLWFLKNDFFKSEFKDCPIVYIPWLNSPLEKQKNFSRLLEILEVDVGDIKPINQPTHFDKIILPDESIFVENGYYKFNMEYRKTIDCVRNFALKNRTPTSSKKLYYLHGMRNQSGEERIAEYFKSKGYDIIRPEKLTFDEQLNLLINCKSFATTIGSISNNSIFLCDGTEAIFIPRYIGRYTGYQNMIEQVHPLEAYYIDSTMSIFATWTDFPCYVISEQLKNFFGDKFEGYEEEDFKTFLQYVKNSMSKGQVINEAIKKSYGLNFTDFMAQLKRREDLISAYDMPPRWETFQPSLTYQTHVHKDSWSKWLGENQISNDTEQKRDIQAIKLNFPSHKVYYSVYYNDKEGWSEEVAAPDMAGTTGKSKAIFGIRIRLDEAGAKEFDILYRVHKFDGSWTAWAKNGEVIYSHGQKLNAIQIKLESK